MNHHHRMPRTILLFEQTKLTNLSHSIPPPFSKCDFQSLVSAHLKLLYVDRRHVEYYGPSLSLSSQLFVKCYFPRRLSLMRSFLSILSFSQLSPRNKRHHHRRRRREFE